MCTYPCGLMARVRRGARHSLETTSPHGEHCCIYACSARRVNSINPLIGCRTREMRSGHEGENVAGKTRMFTGARRFCENPIDSRNQKRLWNPYARSIGSTAQSVNRRWYCQRIKTNKISTQLCRATLRNNKKKSIQIPDMTFG